MDKNDKRLLEFLNTLKEFKNFILSNSIFFLDLNRERLTGIGSPFIPCLRVWGSSENPGLELTIHKQSLNPPSPANIQDWKSFLKFKQENQILNSSLLTFNVCLTFSFRWKVDNGPNFKRQRVILNNPPCKDDNAIFASNIQLCKWKVTWIYTYSPLKQERGI